MLYVLISSITTKTYEVRNPNIVKEVLKSKQSKKKAETDGRDIYYV